MYNRAKCLGRGLLTHSVIKARPRHVKRDYLIAIKCEGKCRLSVCVVHSHTHTHHEVFTQDFETQWRKNTVQCSSIRLHSKNVWIMPLVKFWKCNCISEVGGESFFFFFFESCWENQTLKPEVVTDHSRAQQSEVIGWVQLVKNIMWEQGQERLASTHAETQRVKEKFRKNWGEKRVWWNHSQLVYSKLWYIVSFINLWLSSVYFCLYVCACVCVWPH